MPAPVAASIATSIVAERRTMPKPTGTFAPDNENGRIISCAGAYGRSKPRERKRCDRMRKKGGIVWCCYSTATVASAGTSEVQKAQRDAFSGISLRQNGHSRVVGSGGSSDLRRA